MQHLRQENPLSNSRRNYSHSHCAYGNQCLLSRAVIPNHVCIDSVFEITQHNGVNTNHLSSPALILFPDVGL